MPWRGGCRGSRCRGVAVHIGSQLTDLGPLEAAFGKIGTLIASLRRAGHTISVADLGGGLGVPYDPALPVPPIPAALWRDGGACHRRLERAAGVRAGTADRRQCRRAADAA